MVDIFDPNRVAAVRLWDHLMGGKDNFGVDREAAQDLLRVCPQMASAARWSRQFLQRAIRYLVVDGGIRQYIDLGCGLPMYPSVAEIAQDRDWRCRVVYVDHDTTVGSHARALLVHNDGSTAYVDADIRDPGTILSSKELRGILDLSRPVGVLMSSVLHELTDEDRPYDVIRRLVTALPSGSAVVVSHLTIDLLSRTAGDLLGKFIADGRFGGPFRPRNRDEVAGFLTGLDLVEPGLVSTVEWRPDPRRQPYGSSGEPGDAMCYAAVGTVP